MGTILSEKDKNNASAKAKSGSYLSKSLYIRGLQCHKSLYLEKFHRDIKDEISAEAQARFDTGHAVGEAAQDMFPGGVLVPYIEAEDGVREQLRLTEEVMSNGVEVIYEASFQHDGVFVKVDILRKGKKGWELYEVKAGTELQSVYVDDAALQYYVLTGDKKKIGDFLETISYPLYFLDFETFKSAVPLYDGIRPYQHVPFQYSLHYRKTKGGELCHTEFLADPGTDPRKPLLEKLLKDIPENVCILTYNMTFEKRVLSELAAYFPEHRKAIENRIERIRDLMVPFRQRDFYHWQFKGSYSIKKVLPVLVAGLSYEGLEIADGGAAMDAYHQMCAVKDRPEELAKLRKDLLAYCRLDTLAMVRILDVLGEKVR